MKRITPDDINEIVLSGKSFAIVRLPGEKNIRVKSGNWKRISLDKISKDCFFVQPFSPNEKGFALLDEKEKLFWYESLVPAVTDKKDYLKIFSDFHSQIKNKKFRKLVLSKVKRGSSKKINTGDTFFNLCQKFPRAVVNLFHIPGEGLWMGASPELLLRSDLTKTETMSLAGTVGKGRSAWKEKENEEQQYVTDYIHRIFNKYFKKAVLQKRKTISAGNVKHLCNQFSCTERISWQNLVKLVHELHPTPAVNGLPKEKALKFISTSEAHSREFYAGYFGFAEPGKKLELFVNLRCMKLVNNIPYIFTGGGITADSVAENEWKEAELKAQGLINSLSFGEN